MIQKKDLYLGIIGAFCGGLDVAMVAHGHDLLWFGALAVMCMVQPVVLLWRWK